MSDTFGNVDASDDPNGAADCQDRVDAWPAVVAYKTRAEELLGGAQRVLDVGCGPGNDLCAIGTARSIGVDSSAVMCRRSRERGAQVVVGDAQALPFANRSFDGVRADRVPNICGSRRTPLPRWSG